MSSIRKKQWIKEILLASLTLCAYYLKMGLVELPDYITENMLYGNKFFGALLNIPILFGSVGTISIGVFILLLVFYHFAPPYQGSKAEKAFVFLFSCVAVLAVLLCKSYDSINSWDMVFGSLTAVIVAAIKTVGYAFAIYYIVSFVAKMNIQLQSGEQIEVQNAGKTIALKILLIMACWLPYIILLYPGCFSVDSCDQIAQVLNNKNYIGGSADYLVLLNDDVILNNHHPVIYAWVLKIVLALGRATSYGFAFEVLCVFQSLFLASAFSYLLFVMKKHACKETVLKICTAFFALFPLFPLYGMTIVKDTPYCALTVFVVVLFYELLASEEIKTAKLLFFASVVFAFLMAKNNSVYVMIMTLAVAVVFLLKNKKKMLKIGAAILVPVLIFQIGIVNVLYPALDITPGSKREMLSVPFVQTARYVRDYEKELSKKDKKAILKVMTTDGTIDEILSAYDTTLESKRSDELKDKFNKHATDKDLKAYFKVWLKGLKRHPSTYVQAYFNLHYGWLSYEGYDQGKTYEASYPEELLMALPQFTDFEGNVKLKTAVNIEKWVLNVIPVTKPFLEISTYTWIYIILIIVAIRKKRFTSLVANSIIYFNYLIYMAGPIAYMRYAVPMVCVVPFSIFITSFDDKKTKSG